MAVTSSDTCAPLTRHIVSETERQLAAGNWLLSAVRDRQAARADWAESGVALIPCGTLFSAIRLPADLVHAAAGTTETSAVNAYLREALHGPVFANRHADLYYSLTPASTARHWADPGAEGVAALGKGAFLGVPHPSLTRPEPGRPYWPVPMDSPGVLCDTDAVVQLITEGHTRARQNEGDG
ncbi:MAG TPA: hypothetical protein VFY14_12760 [Streptomyces sp.]|nr:hypothetical protein [Streptomyces sp.]